MILSKHSYIPYNNYHLLSAYSIPGTVLGIPFMAGFNSHKNIPKVSVLALHFR
jgi:hypothetical protein